MTEEEHLKWEQYWREAGQRNLERRLYEQDMKSFADLYEEKMKTQYCIIRTDMAEKEFRTLSELEISGLGVTRFPGRHST